jgi:hypothetical protein
MQILALQLQHMVNSTKSTSNTSKNKSISQSPLHEEVAKCKKILVITQHVFCTQSSNNLFENLKQNKRKLQANCNEKYQLWKN